MSKQITTLGFLLLCAACSSNQDSGPWELGEDAGGDATTDMNEEDLAPLNRVYAITDFTGGHDYWGIRASSTQECLNVVLSNSGSASPFENVVSAQSVEFIFIEDQACVAGAPMHKGAAPETALGATSAVGSIEIFEDYISADLTIEFEGRPAVKIQESQIEFE